MLNRIKHEQILKSILKDIYLNPYLQANLAFKGGTCLYMFYGLERFSIDLDFNLLSNNFDSSLVQHIVNKYVSVEEVSNKHFTWLWIGSYEKGKQKVKIEISKRDYPDKYINKDFYGLTIPTMHPSYMFTHKLCAITDRKKLQMRDLFDTNFMFSKGFEINEDIIRIRMNKSVKDYLNILIKFIEDRKDKINVLDGLGELVSNSQKDKIKSTLLKDILANMHIYSSGLSKTKS
jgi:predicted nucleotidyltransferase component of viral defense system